MQYSESWKNLGRKAGGAVAHSTDLKKEEELYKGEEEENEELELYKGDEEENEEEELYKGDEEENGGGAI